VHEIEDGGLEMLVAGRLDLDQIDKNKKIKRCEEILDIGCF